MNTVTTMGKFRHLCRCSTTAGHFVVLALDHRTNLLDSLNQHADQPLNEYDFIVFKQRIIRAGAQASTAVLTDPAFGIGVGIADRNLPAQIGLLAPLEVTDYNLHPSQRHVNFIPNWSVEHIKRCGADGVKLLLPYHPDAANAEEKHAIVAQIVEQCARWDIPFFLEPIPYSLDAASALTDAERLQITVDMVKRFSTMQVDILKLQFPLENDDETGWNSACKQINAACSTAWTLLSGGVSFDTFMRQALVACESGASGVIVGRAVWNEAITLRGEALYEFLDIIIPRRLRALDSICESGTSWFERIHPPKSGPTWYIDQP